jgi:hypothetical protein
MYKQPFKAPATETLMVASTLDRVEVGQRFASMPPHVTLFPWFDVETAKFEILNRELGEIILEHPRASRPEAGSALFFGVDGSIPVRRLDRPTAGYNVIQDFSIHSSLYKLVNRLHATYDPTYVGLNYAPHISDTSERSIAEGEVIELDNLTIFQKDIRRQKLVKAVHLWDKIEVL